MTGRPSTIRTSEERTIEAPASSDAPRCVSRIVKFWREQADANVIRTCEAFPFLPANRSLLLDLAVEEFKLKRNANASDARRYCARFRKFGESVENSIFRAIEVQNYLDCHPELMELVVDFQWPSPGDSLEGFLVLEELGRGALARAYLCRESKLGGREVVVKVARGNGYEAELIARLDHPNIVPVYSVVNDVEAYVSYICMPFRGRSTLQQLADAASKEVPISFDAIARLAGSGHDRSRFGGTYVDGVIRLVIKLADALCHAHSAGVLHGDLKPSNVLLTATLEPLLIDFNLARDQRSGVAPCGGTLAYMPPEIVEGICEDKASSGDYDVRSEIYSFGALLYVLLTGDLPYPIRDETDAGQVARQLCEAHRSGPPLVRQRNPIVNRGLERLVIDCLAVDRALRPASMHEVWKRLRQQNSTVYRLVRGVSTKPRLAKSVVGLVLGVVMASVLVYASRPSYAVRELRRGMALVERGEYTQAIKAFTDAGTDDIQRPEALRRRALAHLSIGNPKGASNDFNQLYSKHNDLRASAFIGYCFNLQKEHSAAIMWYEKALSEGFESAALRNNLGISYAICQSSAGHLERFEFATKNLERALEIDRECHVARQNLVEVAVIRGGSIGTIELPGIARTVDALLTARPNDSTALILSCRAFGLISNLDPSYLDRCYRMVNDATSAGIGPSKGELTHSSVFSALRSHPRFPDLLAGAPKLLARGVQSVSFELPATAEDFVQSGVRQDDMAN